jgi:hypothetical protein
MTNPKKKWFVWTAWCMAIAFGGCSGPTAVPSSYSTFTDKQNMFKIQYPDGWSCESVGKMEFSKAKFSSGNALIEVEADLTTRALLSEMATTGVNPMSTGGSDLSNPAQKAHWLEKKPFEEQRNVKEEKPEQAKTNLGNGLKSEFTGTYSFGGNFHGYRATSINNNKRIRVVCQCPAGEWSNLKPVFNTVIASLSDNPRPGFDQ